MIVSTAPPTGCSSRPSVAPGTLPPRLTRGAVASLQRDPHNYRQGRNHQRQNQRCLWVGAVGNGSCNGAAVGPSIDLNALWEQHIATEFTEKSADAAVGTMVPHATVNHVPTMTGGVGTEGLRSFYAKHFIPHMPGDVGLIPIDRTIGKDTVVDEFIFEFTHNVRMDWMLPGLAPTGKKVRVPFVVVVKFEGDKLRSERIYWDQATVLVQLGLLDPRGLPVAGAEQAAKQADMAALPSNTLITTGS